MRSRVKPGMTNGKNEIPHRVRNDIQSVTLDSIILIKISFHNVILKVPKELFGISHEPSS